MQTATALSVQERNQLIVEWKQAAEELAAWKEKEMALRLQLAADTAMFNPGIESGTQTYQLGGGWKLKLERKIAYKIENKQGEAFAVMHQLCQMGEGTARVAKELFSFEANLRTGEYKKLTPEERAVVDTILTTKPATPSLSMEAPKDSK